MKNARGLDRFTYRSDLPPLEETFGPTLGPFRCVITNYVEPGGTGTAKFLKIDSMSGSGEPTWGIFTQDYETTSDPTFTVRDINSRNCLLQGEQVDVVFDSQVGAWIPVGSQGLVRKAKAGEAIAINTSGLADLYSGGTVRITDITVHNDWAPSALAEDDEIWIQWMPDEGTAAANETTPGKWTVITTGSGSGDIIPITLSQTGGLAGSKTTQCTFTYTVTNSKSGATLGTAVDPTASPHHFQRHSSIGKCTAATRGLAFDASGGYQIYLINEKLDTGAC